MRIKVAFRNTFRNGRRTLLNVLMVAGGVTAIVLFRGFADRILIDLREATIQAATGHVQIATNAFWDKSAKNPKDVLLSDYKKLVGNIEKIPHVKSVAGRIGFYGLVSTGEKGFSARGVSLDPVAEADKAASLRILQGGRRIASDNPFQVLLGSGLAKQLQVTPSQSVTVLSYTYDGVVNALDMEVVGIFSTGVSEFDDTTFMLPLSATQRLLDTDQAEQLIVGLDDTANTVSALTGIRELVKGEAGVVAKPWSELSEYYNQVDSFFHTQNGVIAFIILCLVVLGVLNTIGMSIYERVGEIGTLRALGETERAILVQFLIEGGILGVIGAFTGVVVGALASLGVNALHIPIIVPGASVPLKIHINFFFAAYWEAVILAVTASILAALIPAFRASKMNIVDALRRNI